MSPGQQERGPSRAGGQSRDDDQRRKPPAPSAVGALLGAYAARRGWTGRLRGARVHECWAEIAGPRLAASTEPVRLQGGVLVLRAESPAWATQVRYLSAELAQRANAVLGEGEVRRIVVVTGSLRGPDTGR